MRKIILITICLLLAISLCVGLTSCRTEEVDSGESVQTSADTECQHLRHDEKTLVCADCGDVAVHRYENGVCSRCDKSTSFALSPIGGQEITLDCDQQGSIINVAYETHSYALEAATGRDDLVLIKHMNVYLPYGYNEDEKYNVLFLLHGAGENEDFWFAQGSYDPTNVTTYLRGYGTQQVLDNMMKEGLAEKTIVVTPTLYSEIDGIDSSDADFTSYFYKELLNDIYPIIVGNYSTYAQSTAEEDLIAARDHFAYAGLSMGSCTGFSSIWTHCVQYMSYIGNYSGAAKNLEAVIEAINGEYANYEIKYWYNGMGTLDGGAKEHETTFETIYAQTDGRFKAGSDIANGDNCDFIWCDGTGHTYACWLTCLYNSMLVFFK